jgi:putative ABC transport system substrate-binding protein
VAARGASAQQRAMPVLGFLSSVAEEAYILAAVRRGLSEQGFVEGRNMQIEYRYARGQYLMPRAWGLLRVTRAR